MSSTISVCPSSLPLGAAITHTPLLSTPRQARGSARVASVSFSGPGGRASGSAVGFIDSFLFLPTRICCFPPKRSSFSSLEFPVGLLQTSSSLRCSRQVTRRGLHAFFSFLQSFDGLQSSGSRPCGLGDRVSRLLSSCSRATRVSSHVSGRLVILARAPVVLPARGDRRRRIVCWLTHSRLPGTDSVI